MRPPPIPLADRFWAKVSIPLREDGLFPDERQCWLWIGAKCGGRPGQGQPYGTIRLDAPSRKQKKAHVVAFYLFHDHWPTPGQDVCHKCDTTLCCNPHHLFEGSHYFNMLDYIKKYGRLGIPKTEWPLAPRPQLPLEDEDAADPS